MEKGSMEPVIRRATVADAEAAARCHLLCWREAYDGVADPEKLLARTSDLPRRTERWAGQIEAGLDRWIALNPSADEPIDDRVIGFASPGPARDEDAPAPLELYAIYVREKWWGSGLATRLLDVAIGKEAASLWVFEDNPRALAFYAKHGFAADGARSDDPAFGLTEIRLVRSGV
jgi:GNAT superfamily N-acetyltransferase